jgi:RNA recognition motif-containing protein
MIAFVTYKEEKDAEKALEELQGTEVKGVK